jgi:hypothetical protein
VATSVQLVAAYLVPASWVHYYQASWLPVANQTAFDSPDAYSRGIQAAPVASPLQQTAPTGQLHQPAPGEPRDSTLSQQMWFPSLLASDQWPPPHPVLTNMSELNLQCTPKTETATLCEVMSCEEEIPYTFEARICHGSLWSTAETPPFQASRQRSKDTAPWLALQDSTFLSRNGENVRNTRNCSVQLV